MPLGELHARLCEHGGLLRALDTFRDDREARCVEQRGEAREPLRTLRIGAELRDELGRPTFTKSK